MKKVISFLSFLLLYATLVAAGVQQSPAAAPAADSLYVFRFVAGNDMFYIPWGGNDAQLRALCRVVDTHRAAIVAGRLPVYVDSYCASLPTEKENLRTAFVRASRVKSELILREGLKEADFMTANYARAYSAARKDVVVVTLCIPADAVPPGDTVPPADPVILSNAKDLPPQSTEQEMLHSVQQDNEGAGAAPPYRFALRTNLLYDALLLPTLGMEWRVNDRFGVRLGGSLAWWGGETDKVQKIWLLNAEVRCYLLRNRRFYVGASGSFGEYNIYRYPLGKLLSDDTDYQGHLWYAGVAVGYQLRLSRCLSADFNLGLGYTCSEYDSFTMIDKVRVIKDRDKSKSFWGPTQAGISLVWTIGSKE